MNFTHLINSGAIKTSRVDDSYKIEALSIICVQQMGLFPNPNM